MLSDISQVAALDPHDVVIVGGGAAGLTLAHRLSGKGLRILVLEAGGEKRTSEAQDFYRGDVTDPLVHPSIDRYRERAIGGTSRIWGGRLVPFDPIDFGRRPWVPRSGWPITFDTLKPYYERAVFEAEGGKYAFSPAEALPRSQRELVKGLDGIFLTTTIERFSKPTNFWRHFGESLRRSKDVKVVLNASVTGIQLTDQGSSVACIEIVGRDGIARSVVGRLYVLALGGLETTRLLLVSNRMRADGIGNTSGELGRNYMTHLSATAGIITFRGPPHDVGYDYERDNDGIYLRRRLWLNETAQRRFELLNTTFQTHFPDPSNPDHGDAILSAMFLVKNLVLYEYSRKFSESEVGWSERVKHILNVLGQPARLTTFGFNWLHKRTFADRKLPSLVLGSSLNRYVLQFLAEQSPNPSSRLTLSTDCDRLGMPRLKVDWRPCELDFESIRRSCRLLSDELARTGTGSLEYNTDALTDSARRHGIVGGHHIGTTRMSDDPRQGVVNADCRVHDVENLFVISASVFPTSGQANPTLTLLALALRLADKLHVQLR
jgi:choline dehydrogenase-like flavoprotein